MPQNPQFVPALQSAAGVFKVGSTFISARNARNAARANAATAQAQAVDALQRGEVAYGRQRTETANLKARQKASFAARGVALDEGSPLAVLASTEAMGELDAATIRENARREADGFSAQAANYLREAHAANPWLAATGSLLSEAATIGSRWQRRKKVGVGKKPGKV